MRTNTTHTEAFEQDHAADRRQRKAPTDARIELEDLTTVTSGNPLAGAVVHDSIKPAKSGTLVMPVGNPKRP
jgi:hypothetical protein